MDPERNIDQPNEAIIPAENRKNVEIEKKYLVDQAPADLEQYPHQEIAQGYLAVDDQGNEVRIRKKGDRFFQTLKTGTGQTRGEFEAEITAEQFHTFWPATASRRIEKTRYEIPYHDRITHFDVYGGALSGLMTAEVEFDDEEQGHQFVAPDWFGREVTEDKRFKNQNLALHGLPMEKYNQAPIREKLSIPEFTLKEGAQELIRLCHEKLENVEQLVVEVAGGSASGKTSEVAKRIMEAFGEDALILSLDDYYRGKAYMDAQAGLGNVLNWDQPEAVNLRLAAQQIQALKSGQPIEKPVYDFKVSQATRTETVQPHRVIIIEGLFALNDELGEAGDIKAFVNIGTHGRILRRMLRDIERTGQRPVDIMNYFAEFVEPMHDKYIESTKKNADLIINNEYNPSVEAERSGLHEVQVKFKNEIEAETLRRLGAERLGVVMQTDHYYNPHDRNLVDTGEILRIRDEADRRILTYKGPKIDSEFRQRPKFEFEIDQDTEDKFLAIYGNEIKTIRKERTLYHLDGVVFSVDSVDKEEDHQAEHLGKFIEIRTTDKSFDRDKIDSLLAKLGLNFRDKITASYFEM